MSDIIMFKGKVKYPITLDPGVWIFDDRKKKLEEFFQTDNDMQSEETYQQHMARQWERALQEGAVPTKKSEELFVHKKDIRGDYGIPLAPFIANAEPLEDAGSFVCHLENGDTAAMDLKTAMQSILCFAVDGHPIREDGPVHLYFGDGSNRENPIKGIQYFELK